MNYPTNAARGAAWLLFAFVLPAASLHAQDILWEKSYGGKHADYLFDAQPTPDNGFILAGSSLSKKTGNKTEENRGDLDYWVWKMDAKGDLDWQKSFGGSGMDMLQSVRLTGDGGFILAGTSDSPKGLDKKEDGHGQQDFWIIKLDAKGGEQWQRTIGGDSQELLQSVIPTRDGGYLLGGSSASGKSKDDTTTEGNFFGKSQDGFGNLDYWVVKLDNKGKIEWQQTFGGSYADQLRSLVQTADGGYLLGGSSNSPASGNKTAPGKGKSDYWIIRLDEKGNPEWEQVFGGEQDEQLSVITQLTDGNYMAAGYGSKGTGTDFLLLKLDTKGNTIWEQTYNIGKTDILTSLIENEDGSLLLGGHAKSEATGKSANGKVSRDKEGINDYVVLKIDAKGEEQWTKSVGSQGEDILRKVFELRDGGYLMAGTSNGKNGDKQSGIGRNDFWVVKLKDKKKPDKPSQKVEAIPNPAQQYTNIIVGYEFEKGTATVYDLGGRQLQQFVIESRTVPVNLGALPEGIYIVQISTDISTDSVKVIKGN